MNIKKTIMSILIRNMEKSLVDTQKARNREHDEMLNAPSAMESHSDTTRSQKEGVVFGLDKRIAEYKNDIANLKELSKSGIKKSSECRLFSLVKTEYNDGQRFFFILPCAGGEKVNYNNTLFNIITMEAPISRALLGKKAQEEFGFKLGNKVIEGYIEKVY